MMDISASKIALMRYELVLIFVKFLLNLYVLAFLLTELFYVELSFVEIFDSIQNIITKIKLRYAFIHHMLNSTLLLL